MNSGFEASFCYLCILISYCNLCTLHIRSCDELKDEPSLNILIVFLDPSSNSNMKCSRCFLRDKNISFYTVTVWLLVLILFSLCLNGMKSVAKL